MQVVAKIQIEMLDDGNIRCGANVPSMFMLMGMLETAKQVLAAQITEQAKQKIVLPDPLAGISLRN